MNRLSVVIIAMNEEANLPRCLKSVEWADDVVMVDSGSTDRTAEIAREFGARVFDTEWRGFGLVKREAVAHAEGDWILSIDADEVVPPELAAEIRQVIADSNDKVGYYIPRRTQFLGRWIYHCGWYPDPVLRLFRRGRGDFDAAVVHEQVVVSGPVGQLRNDLLHYSYPSLDCYFEKFNRYTTLAAEKALAEGRTAGVWQIVMRPLACFLKHYIFKRGFLDGLEGLVLSVLSACHVLVKYAKLRDLVRKNKTKETTAI